MEHKQASEEATMIEDPVAKCNSNAEHFDKAIELLLEFDCSEVRVGNRMSIDGVPDRDRHIDLTLFDDHEESPSGTREVRVISATVTPDAKKGPEAKVSWASIGAVSPGLARIFAMGLLRAADLAERGLAEKLKESPAKKLRTRKKAP